MSAAALQTAETDPAALRAARRIARLERLSEIGMAIAEALGERLAEAQAAGEADEAVVQAIGVVSPGVV